MYSLIWVGWLLVKLFVKKHQMLRLSGCDWSFSIRECTIEHCQTVTVVI